jgi:hypothetical protein
MSGVMGGVDMLSFVPLGERSDELSGTLNCWVRTRWKNDSRSDWLTLEGWFDLSARQGWFMWCPLPSTDNAVLEQMYKAQQKHPHTSVYIHLSSNYDLTVAEEVI